jgi:hypothetical protein
LTDRELTFRENRLLCSESEGRSSRTTPEVPLVVYQAAGEEGADRASAAYPV